MTHPIALRAMRQSDLPLFRAWLHLPHVAAWFRDPEDWIFEVEHQDGAFSFVRHFIVEARGRPVGFCQYYEYRHSGEDWHGDTPLAGTYSIDYLIGETAFLGKGYGRRIVLALLDRIRSHPDAARVIVQPEPENLPSCRALLACGFRHDAANGIYIREGFGGL